MNFFDITPVWNWATATLSPASVILFLLAFAFAGIAFWFLKELRKADLKVVDLQKVEIDTLNKKVKEQQTKIEADAKAMTALQIDVVKLTAELKLYKDKVDHLEGLIKMLGELYKGSADDDANT